MRTLAAWIIAAIAVPGAAAADAPLSFEDALVRLVEASTALQIQRTEVEGAEIKETRARYQFAPTFSVVGQEIRTGSSLGPSIQTGRQAVGSSDLNLYRFGADAAELRAAVQERESVARQYESAWLDAELAAVGLLVDQIARELGVEIDREFVKIREQSFQIARERFSQGLLAQQEVEKIQVDLENSRSKLADTEVQRAQSAAALLARIGTDAIDTAWPWRKRLMDRQSRIFSVVAVEPHPRLRSAALALEAQEARLSAKRGAAWPTLDANMSYGFYDGAAAGVSRPQRAWTGTLSLTLPLFSRLSSRTEIGLQAQAVTAADRRREGVRIDLDQEKRASRAAFDLALDSVKRRVETLQISKRIYQDNMRRFRAGRVSADELSIDQNRLLTSQLLEVDGWAALHRASARFCHASGLKLAECL